MTGRIVTRAEWRARIGQIAAQFPAAANLLRGGETVRDLWAISPHSRTVCRQVLDLCWDRIGTPDWEQEEWLRLLYAHLSDALFPERDQAAQPFSHRESLYLAVLELVLDHKAETFDHLLDLIPLQEEEIADSRVKDQYLRFLRQVQSDHIPALLTLGRELMPFDPASHTVGVHNVALHIGALARQAGLDVDLPLVRAAAFGHDIGKFGCRGEDAGRIPYLHYYYTWQWFRAHEMEEIGYISANHSTWDLEFENLPVESLLLIYADFRVRGVRDPESGRETMAIYSLTEAYEAIFSKLYDMTPEKKRRYETVYYKLLDFQRFLESKGVPTDLHRTELRRLEDPDPALLSPEQALQALRSMTLSHSIRLMGMVSREESFTQLLEQTKREKSQPSIRTYLHLLEEYNPYLTAENKRKTLALLYELLMHPEGDVRRKAGQIMGMILANSGPKYRKERPSAALDGEPPPAMMALLEETVSLWRQYILQCLHPDRKLSSKHAQRISNSLKTICGSLFAHCDEKEARPLAEPLLEELRQAEGSDRFVLADALYQVPCAFWPAETLPSMLDALENMLKDGDLSLRLAALRCLERLRTQRPETASRIRSVVENSSAPAGEGSLAFAGMQASVMGEPYPDLDGEDTSALYLSDLKNAVPWMVKLVQIDLLIDHALRHPDSAFLTGMHLSNLLSVSEHLPVREHAGDGLLKLCPLLTVAQINEIAIDLLRELESGQEQISRFIPPYAGRILCMLPDKERAEAIHQLEALVQGTSARPARAALYTLGEILASTEDEALSRQVLSMLMIGVSHYEGTIHRTALTVLCREVFGSGRIGLKRKRDFFVLLHKKLLTILSEPMEDRLTFFSRAAMLNHLYRFVVRCQVELGGFLFPPRKPAAFFPGTFDPFSVGHKRIVEEIRARNFEVYLAVDEFSWSKRTLPRQLRRRIVGMSIADQWDTYLFPDEIPINLASDEDLDHLKQLLRGGELYLVAGDDVIHNASAYRNGRAADLDHIVFLREGDREDTLHQMIRGKLITLSLPSFYDAVSSTRIRTHVDQDLDISMLVTPMVQSFIYENSLYVRSPEEKSVLRRQDLYFRACHIGEPSLPESLNKLLGRTDARGTVLRRRPDTMLGWAVGHTIRTAELYDTLRSLEGANFVRRHTSGRILMVDQVCVEGLPHLANAICRMLLNELLSRSLEDHTYALCRCRETDGPLFYALEQLGFASVPGLEDTFCVDMRSPVMLLQDVLLQIKEPHRDSPAVRNVVAEIRPRLRSALTSLFPGKLVLCFDSELLNQALMERVQQLNGVYNVPPGEKRLGPCMCVPYGKILADEVVPNTVTKALRVEKRFLPDLRGFEVVEHPGYSSLKTQSRTLRSFGRPVILVDDLLHKGYRIEKLDKVFRETDLTTHRIVVAVMSGYGRDLMQVQGRQVDCEYFIPNLHYWVTESLLYPFIGGDSVGPPLPGGQYLPSINMILPYYYPSYLEDAEDEAIRALSRTALENTCALLKALEETHQRVFQTHLTIGHLAEVLRQPRLPDRGRSGKYDLTMAPSAYLEDDLAMLDRIVRKEGKHYDL